MDDAPVPWSSLCPCAERSPSKSISLSCTGEPRTGLSTPYVLHLLYSSTPPVPSRRGNITSFDLLTVLFLTLPNMLLVFCATRVHCLLTFDYMSTRIPRSFSAQLVSSWLASSMYCCLGLFLHRWKIWHFSLMNFMTFLLAHSSSLLRSLWMSTWLSCACKFAEGVLSPINQVVNEAAEQD